MRQPIIILIFLIFKINSFAQIISANYSGEVIYEIKYNKYERARKILKNEVFEDLFSNYLSELKNNRFDVKSYHMYFDKNKSFYTSKNNPLSKNNLDLYSDMPLESIHKDEVLDSIFMKRNVLGSTILIKDKNIPIKWKFTNEHLNIAGYNCRRANGIILDSVYVIAFYCEEIQVTHGPSIFRGLPGLILGISLPHDNINIFAKEIFLKDTTFPIIPKHSNDKKTILEYIEYIRRTLYSTKKNLHRLDFNIRTALF